MKLTKNDVAFLALCAVTWPLFELLIWWDRR